MPDVPPRLPALPYFGPFLRLRPAVLACLFLAAGLLEAPQRLLPACIAGEASAAPEAASAPTVLALPALNTPAVWKTPAEGSAIQRLSAAGDYLRVDLLTMKGQVGELRLQTPQPFPAWADDLYFRCTNAGGNFSFQADAIVLDSAGREFYFYSKSNYSFEQGLVVSHPQRRVTEYWHRFPAFAALMRNNYAAKDNNYSAKPKPPFSFAGLRLRGQYSRWSEKDQSSAEASLYFTGFTCTNLSPRDTSFYYQFADQEFFGELAPLPYFTAGQAMRSKWGKGYSISWELRSDYAGQPILCGGESRQYPDNWPTDANPELVNARVADYARHLVVPVKQEGTYWVRVRTRWSPGGKPVPEEIEEKEFRLSIDKGEKQPLSKNVTPETFAPGSYIRVAPARPSLTFAPAEPLALPVLFRKPETALPGCSLVVSIRNALGDTVYTQALPDPKWNEHGVCTFTPALPDLVPGSYELTAALQSEGKDFDRTTVLLGRSGEALSPTQASAPLSSQTPFWKEVLGRTDPLVFLCLCLPDNDNSRRDAKLAWEKHYRPFLDDASELSNTIEVQIPWAQVERMPGIYDWAAFDRIVEYARAKGYQISFAPEFRATSMPEWIPSICEKNAEGRIYGSNSYLFHNTRPNFLLAPQIRDRFFAFITELARHYRNNPAVLSYFLCVEHPRDAAYLGWYEGFSEENLPFFRADCRQQFPTIEALNKEWGTRFVSFDEIRHPQDGDPDAFRTGWLAFRIRVIETFLKDFVRIVRNQDARRLILVYTDGLRDVPWFRDQGCMTADGGSATGMGILQAKMFGNSGFHRRTEDINPGFWASAKYPSEIEASLFNISSGGAWTTHVKCYVRADKKTVREQLADPTIGLGKMKTLLPVWRELHKAYAYAPQVYVYGNLMSALQRTRSTYFGDEAGGAWAILNAERAQLNPSIARDETFPAEAKMMLLIDQQMNALPQASIDRLVQYVEDGGTLLMLADCGRQVIEPYAPGDWTLLRRLGFAAPEEKDYGRGFAPVVTGKNEVFSVEGEEFVLREAWRSTYNPQSHGQRLAAFKGLPDSCAVSWKPLGKGKAVVVWAETIVPEQKPFLQDIARWAGATIRATTDQPAFWTNLQHNQDETRFYGMVNNVAWPIDSGKPASGTLNWLSLPEGSYKVTAMVRGKELGVMTAQQLRNGLPWSLGPRAAEFFRFEKTAGN